MNPYMDPATAYMYSMMNPYAFPPFNPYLYNPFFMQRPPMDDQQSLHSYQFDFDSRSEKKLNNNSSSMPLRAQSVVGYKLEPMDHQQQQQQQRAVNQQGLLIEDLHHHHQHHHFGAQNTMDSSALLNDTSVLTKKESEQQQQQQHRLTPQMHQLPHVRASFSINGLVQIRANDPCEGQPALVDIFNLSDIMEQHLTNLRKQSVEERSINNSDPTGGHDDATEEEEFSAEMSKELLHNYRLLQEFPGPLQREHTSRAQLIQFCQKFVKDCLSSNMASSNLIDPQSHALLWDYLALLVRQNGIVDLKTDISPLLLSGIVESSNQHQQQQQQMDFVMIGENNAAASAAASLIDEQSKKVHQSLNEDEMHLNRLRQLLSSGQRTDAIEYSMKHNMWPHALFLASAQLSTLPTSGSSAGGLIPTSNSLVNVAATLNSTTSNSIMNMANETKTLHKVKTRFINSLQSNDPIQTCYQLLIGRVPTVSNVMP